MTASSPHELAALRARAYGPHADIDEDPDALARLRELEERERAAARVDAPESEPAQEAATASRVEQTTGPDAAANRRGAVEFEGDAAAQLIALANTPAPSAPRPISPAWIIAWAASVLVVALVVGGVVFGLASIKPVSSATGATQVASLTDPVDMSEMAWARQWFGGMDDATGYTYLGLVVSRTPTGVFQSGSDCLLVMRADAYNEADQSFRGQVYTGCSAAGFPASVQFVVDGEAPEELRDRFGNGTGLQFVLDGDVVGVFAVDAPSPTPTVATGD